MIALDFQGLGLPWYEWNQIVNLISRTSEEVNSDLTCDSGMGGKCTLAQSCDTEVYAPLWDYFFNIQFDKDSQMFATVNFGSFAINNETLGTCDLYMQVLQEDQA